MTRALSRQLPDLEKISAQRPEILLRRRAPAGYGNRPPPKKGESPVAAEPRPLKQSDNLNSRGQQQFLVGQLFQLPDSPRLSIILVTSDSFIVLV